MQTPRSKKTFARVLLWFGVIFGAVMSVLIVAGVMGPGLWFTVVAMVLLAVSQWMTLRSLNRDDPQG